MNVDASVKVRNAHASSHRQLHVKLTWEKMILQHVQWEVTPSHRWIAGSPSSLFGNTQHSNPAFTHTDRSLTLDPTRKKQAWSPISFSVRAAYFGGIWRAWGSVLWIAKSAVTSKTYKVAFLHTQPIAHPRAQGLPELRHNLSSMDRDIIHNVQILFMSWLVVNYMDYIIKERIVDDKPIAHPRAQRLPKLVIVFYPWRHDVIHNSHVLFTSWLVMNYIDCISNERSGWQLGLVGGHNQLVCRHNMRIMDDIVSPWMKHIYNYKNPSS